MRRGDFFVWVASPWQLSMKLPQFDGVIFGARTRFGNRTSQLSSFLDQTGALWAEARLVGTPAGGLHRRAAWKDGLSEDEITIGHACGIRFAENA